jgi:hypothetical protein
MQVGAPVEVHTSFTDSWAAGFEIAEVQEDGFAVRRTSDGALLPHTTSPTDLRSVPTTRGR